ncbi:MAG TPA: quinone-dependent dihydroorotate dehydrogenase [Candidatus Binataceae bacterium]|nr:quinone-dependent dihydroorotate dehydrogenase [Candidatus Binataceae bacterium]
MLTELYKLARPVLFRCDAEAAHRMTLAMLSTWPLLAPPADPPELRVKLWDLEFSNPVGLAAGMDKDAVAAAAWQGLGFGFAELGTVTPLPQPGNPRPRVFRLPQHHALINRLGFPSDGMEAVARRIERMRARGIALRLGLNLGPNKDTAAERVAGDYAALVARMAPCADFIVINVSSPNTPGLRDWQSPARMREIVAAITGAMQPAARRPPILLKVAPDLEPGDLHRICDTALELALDGIVATNTTVARDAVGVASDQTGGLSGAPLCGSARAVIGEIHRHCAGRLKIIGVGGVASAEDAWQHIRAGASLVELYTGLIYAGPGVVATIKDGLVALLRREGFRSISDAVGTGN